MGKVLALVLLAGGVLAALVWWWSDVTPSERTYVTDIDPDAVRNARAYDDAPVLWVGAKFDIEGDGTPEPLASFRVLDREVEDPGRLPDELLIGYGQCELSSDSGCTLPLSFRIKFTCAPINERRGEEIVRGALAARRSHLRLITDEVQITVYTDERHERRALAALHGANSLAAHVTPASDLTDLVDKCRRS